MAESGDGTNSNLDLCTEAEVPAELQEMMSDPRFKEYVEKTGHVRTEPGLFVSGWDKDDPEEEDNGNGMDTDDVEAQILKAAEHGDIDSVNRLLDENPQLVHVKDEDEYTPMHRASYNNHADVVKLLISRGGSPRALTEQGWTPLHCAACWGCSKSAAALLECDQVDVNAKSNGNLTPLHLVAACTDDPQGALQTAKLLLSHSGILTNELSSGGERPIDIAKRHSGGMFAAFDAAVNQGQAVA